MKTQSIIVECIRCKREFEPTREDVQRGRWKLCPDCRE